MARPCLKSWEFQLNRPFAAHIHLPCPTRLSLPPRCTISAVRSCTYERVLGNGTECNGERDRNGMRWKRRDRSREGGAGGSLTGARRGPNRQPFRLLARVRDIDSHLAISIERGRGSVLCPRIYSMARFRYSKGSPACRIFFRDDDDDDSMMFDFQMRKKSLRFYALFLMIILTYLIKSFFFR